MISTLWMVCVGCVGCVGWNRYADTDVSVEENDCVRDRAEQRPGCSAQATTHPDLGLVRLGGDRG